MPQIFAGLFAEGNTDVDFLQNIVQKTLQALAFECSGQLDIEVLPIKIDKSGLDFCDQVLSASKKGLEDYGIQILCVHSDADSPSSINIYQNKIFPSKHKLAQQNQTDFCKILVAIVPIQETESWMLADKALLKQEIGTNKSDNELGINKQPEEISNPKAVIANAIRIAREGLTQKRRRLLTINELYLPLGQSMDLTKLESLLSYQDFKNNIREAFIQLNLLH